MFSMNDREDIQCVVPQDANSRLPASSATNTRTHTLHLHSRSIVPPKPLCYKNLQEPSHTLDPKTRLAAMLLLLLAPSPILMPPKTRARKTAAKKPGTAIAKTPAWIEQTLRKMTLREKLGQMLMVSYFGVFTSTESAEYKTCSTKSRKTTSAA